MKLRGFGLVMVALLGWPLLAAEAPVVIQDATILTITHGVIPHGSVVFENGKITAVGEKVAIPKSATIISARGKFVMPGLIDPHSHLGVYSLPGVQANSDGNELTGPIQAQVRAEDSFNPNDPAISRAVAGGVTTVQAIPGSGNLVGGLTVVVKLKGGNLDEIKFPGAPPGIKMAWGENAKRVYGARHEMPSTLMGEAASLRAALLRTRNYMDNWDRWEKGDRKEPPPDRDLQLETLADVLRGKIRVHVHCYRTDHILTLFRIADEFGFRITALHHALEAYKLADLIAARHVGVVTFADMWGYKLEAWDAIPENIQILSHAGVVTSLHTDHPVIEQRYYLFQADLARHYGLSEEEALAAVTINPARLLGIENRVGSIETGKDADLVIYSGPPLEVQSRAEKVFIDGKLVYTLDSGYLPWKGAPPTLFAVGGGN